MLYGHFLFFTRRYMLKKNGAKNGIKAFFVLKCPFPEILDYFSFSMLVQCDWQKREKNLQGCIQELI